MLTYHLRKSLLFLSLLLIVLVGFVRCGNRHEMDPKQEAIELNKPNSDATRERDEKFMVQAQEFHFQGIMLGKIGHQRASAEEVKAMAKILEDAYRTARSELSSLAIRKSIAVPSAATQKVMETVDKLNEKSVEEFDAEYCALILESQKEAIRCFEVYTDGLGDPEIRAWGLSMLPIMRNHLSQITEIDAHMNPVSELIRK